MDMGLLGSSSRAKRARSSWSLHSWWEGDGNNCELLEEEATDALLVWIWDGVVELTLGGCGNDSLDSRPYSISDPLERSPSSWGCCWLFEDDKCTEHWKYASVASLTPLMRLWGHFPQATNQYSFRYRRITTFRTQVSKNIVTYCQVDSHFI